MATITAQAQTKPEVIETGEGVFLVAPDGTIMERLQGPHEPCITCGDTDCDFDCDGED